MKMTAAATATGSESNEMRMRVSEITINACYYKST